MGYYQKHVFLCTNQKPPGKQCCANTGGDSFFTYFKSRLTELGIYGPEQIRVSKSGCLGRCSSGPCVVIYPDNVWYTYSSLEDVEQIISDHLLADKKVERLLIDPVGV